MSTGLTSAVSPRMPRRAALARAAEHSIFGVVPAVATVALIVFQFRIHAVAVDFHVAYWPAANRLLHGMSPYASSAGEITGGTAFVYPALSAVLFAPFALLSRGVAQVLYMLICLLCGPATLRVLNVRDWRVYGVVMLWLPVFVGWQSGNVTLPLTLMVALAWRHREKPLVVGLLTAAAISLKPFVWPLALWLIVTRRWVATGWAVASGLVINAVAWAVVGIGQVRPYLDLSGAVTNALWRQGYSMLAVGHQLGLGRGASDGLLLAVSLLLVCGMLYVGALRRESENALILAVVLMLVASPLLWSHYFSLLLIPVALRRPTLSPIWGLPLLMWPMPPRQPVHGWEEGLAWGVTLLTLLALRGHPSGRRHRPFA